jgi:hypothetical protein
MTVATVQGDGLNVPIYTTHQLARVEHRMHSFSVDPMRERTIVRTHFVPRGEMVMHVMSMACTSSERVCVAVEQVRCITEARNAVVQGECHCGRRRLCLRLSLSAVHFDAVGQFTKMERTASWQPTHEHEPLVARIPHGSGVCCL